MQPRKLNVLFAFFCYTGNSTGTSVVWPVASWWAQTACRLKTEEKFISRIGDFWEYEVSDTPITMTRNKVVEVARKRGADIIVMVDSDMHPDVHLKDDPTAERFFDVAFDAIYEHWDKGPLVVGAPYGGSPPHENMFVFTWEAKANMGDESPFELRQYLRSEAQQMMGLQECAALPTGLIAYDIRAFDCIEKPYFAYEWLDESASQKASTEDVQNTRDISLSCIKIHGYNPLRCAWSSWAGHGKYWCVGKPNKYTADDVAGNLVKAVERGIKHDEREIDLTANWDLSNIKTAPPVDLPDNFPVEILNQVPDITKLDWQVRDNFSVETVSFLHMMPMEDLGALRSFVQAESLLLNRKVKYLEVGSWLGDSAVAVSPFCQSVSCIDNFCGIDETWQKFIDEFVGGAKVVKDIFMWNTRNVFGRHVYDGLSSEMAALCPDDDYDIIFIDGDHSYESVKQDIESWWPHLRSGGAMIGHDYKDEQFPDIEKAVDELFDGKAETYFVHESGKFWCVRKDEKKQALRNHFEKMHEFVNHETGNGKTVPKVIELPEGFPMGILEQIPERVRTVNVGTRDVFGHKTVWYCHQTPMVHLQAIRSACESWASLHKEKPRYLEIGSWTGDSAIAVADVCKYVTCVDHFRGSNGDLTGHISTIADDAVEKIFDFNTRNFNSIFCVKGDSTTAARLCGVNGPYDIILIDADHSYEATKADIEAWWPYLAHNGWMIGHDYLTEEFPGVEKAVLELFGSNVRPYAVDQEYGGFWFVKKHEVGEFLHAPAT